MGIILDSIDFKKGYKVLDIGCRNGSLLIELSNRIDDSCELIGIDASKKNIEKAKKSSKNKNIKFEVGLIENMHYDDKYFDVILSTFLFHHLSFDIMNKGIKELKRVLKPKGKILIIDIGKPIGLYSKFITPFTLWHKHIYSNIHSEVEDILKKNSFKILDIKNTTRLVGTINIILAEK